MGPACRFISRIDDLTIAQDADARRTAADAHLAGSSWDRTWAAMRALIETAAQPAATETLEVAHV